MFATLNKKDHRDQLLSHGQELARLTSIEGWSSICLDDEIDKCY